MPEARRQGEQPHAAAHGSGGRAPRRSLLAHAPRGVRSAAVHHGRVLGALHHVTCSGCLGARRVAGWGYISAARTSRRHLAFNLETLRVQSSIDDDMISMAGDQWELEARIHAPPPARHSREDAPQAAMVRQQERHAHLHHGRSKEFMRLRFQPHDQVRRAAGRRRSVQLVEELVEKVYNPLNYGGRNASPLTYETDFFTP